MLSAKAVVIGAMRLPAGVLNSSNMRVLLNSSGYVEHRLNSVDHDLARFLEDHGFLALPVHPDIPVDMGKKQALMGSSPINMPRWLRGLVSLVQVHSS